MTRTTPTSRKRKADQKKQAVVDEKKRIRREPYLKKQAAFEKEAPPSRFTELPSKCRETLLEEIENFLATRITDKWLLLEREKLRREHADHSEDSISSLLLSSLSLDEKFKGKDLKELISKHRDTTLIESTRVSSYISIGVENLNTYLKRGGSIYLILCGEANLRENIVCRDSIKTVPIFVIPGLTEVLTGFTELKEGKCCDAIAFKKVKDSPFDALLKLLVEKIPDEVSPSVSTDSDTTDDFKQVSPAESIVKLKPNFTGRLPQINIEDQQVIITKLDTILMDTFPRFLVGCKRTFLQQKNTLLDREEIDKHLYLDILCDEFCSGLDIIGILPSSCDKLSDYYVVPFPTQMYKHINKCGSFHFMLFCKSAKDYVNKNRGFSFRKVIPQFEVEGLSSITTKYFGLLDERERTVLAFKKVEDNPYEDFIKFVEDKVGTL